MGQTGVLLPVSALPSPSGIGEFGQEAYEWLDMLAQAGISIWQILPLNPVGYGNSPYQPYSSLAGDEVYISLELLYRQGLLAEPPQPGEKAAGSPGRVDYDGVRSWKEPYLRQAFRNFKESGEYTRFAEQGWVFDYGVFCALRRENQGRCWNEWPREQKYWPKERGLDLAPYMEDIRYEMFLQFLFYTQWMRVKAYAGEKHIRIMGDVPFYVGVDSLDVWTGKENFLLDAQGRPAFIAGVPPDYFSATGQRWGNPIYDWEYMRKADWRFWTERIGYNQKLFDIIRIDHFRAFDTYWKIPASCPTAVEGEWVEAPGYEVLDTLKREVPGVSLVAEDLGMLRPQVMELKEHYGLKGMKILQFTVNTDHKWAFDDFEDTENMIIYTGTHDNMTIRQWYESLSAARRRKVRKWLKSQGLKNGTVSGRLITYALKSRAEYAIIPAADLMEAGGEARLNTPGTVGPPNWEWKMEDFGDIRRALKKYRGVIGGRR